MKQIALAPATGWFLQAGFDDDPTPIAFFAAIYDPDEDHAQTYGVDFSGCWFRSTENDPEDGWNFVYAPAITGPFCA